MKIVLSVFLAIISVVALIGNAMVVTLHLRKREWLKKVHSCLLLALAVQDILTAVGLVSLPGFVQSANPYAIPRDPFFRRLYCSLIWSRYIPFALAISSVYTCLMLAVDRWFAVFRPLSYRWFCSSWKVITTMVICPWIAGFAFEINTALNVRDVKQNDGSYACRWNEHNPSPKSNAIAIFTFFGMIILPAILMIIVYVKIVIKRREQAARVFPTSHLSRQRANSMAPNREQMSAKANTSLKRLTRIAFAASAIVMVCWLPDQLYFCLFQLGFVGLRNGFHDALIVLGFLNICLNPFLYSFSNKLYAKEFEMAILCCVY